VDQWSGGLGGEESTRGSENVQRCKGGKVETRGNTQEVVGRWGRG
jgi:hypothetical protein